MKLLLIQPSVGKIHGEKYVKSWTMEPLALSTLAGMTPDDIDIQLIDERIDELPEIYEADLVGITIVTKIFIYLKKHNTSHIWMSLQV